MKTSADKLFIAGQTLVLLALVVMTVCIWTLSKELSDLGRGQAQYQKTVNTRLAQQSDAINRALGDVIPFKLSSDTQARIDMIERVLSDEKRWPRTQDAVQKLSDELASVVDAVPSWAQDDVLPQLLSKRWEINSIALLVMKRPDQLDSLLDYRQALHGQIERRPAKTSDVLFEQLEEAAHSLQPTITDLTRAAAQAAIRSGDLNRAADLAVSLGTADKELTAELDAATLARQLKEDLTILSKTIELVPTVSDPELKAYILNSAQGGMLNVDVQLLTNPDLPAEIRTTRDNVKKALDTQIGDAKNIQRTKSQSSYRDYQVWALGEIKMVPELSEIRAALNNKIKSVIARNNPISDEATEAALEAQEELAKSMISHLAPINQGLLDVAVGQWFQKVYQDRFEHLDANHKLEVVEQFAVTPKKSMEDHS